MDHKRGPLNYKTQIKCFRTPVDTSFSFFILATETRVQNFVVPFVYTLYGTSGWLRHTSSSLPPHHNHHSHYYRRYCYYFHKLN
jgi:hypothetical protein